MLLISVSSLKSFKTISTHLNFKYRNLKKNPKNPKTLPPQIESAPRVLLQSSHQLLHHAALSWATHLHETPLRRYEWADPAGLRPALRWGKRSALKEQCAQTWMKRLSCVVTGDSGLEPLSCRSPLFFWNRLPLDVKEASSTAAFKSRLYSVFLSGLVCFIIAPFCVFISIF